MRRLLLGDCTPDVFLGYSTGRRPWNAKLENPRPIPPAVELMGRGARFYDAALLRAMRGLSPFWTPADGVSGMEMLEMFSPPPLQY